MRAGRVLHGVDFTSAPRGGARGKSIAWATGRAADGGLVVVETVARLDDFASFEERLGRVGAGEVVALDLPFGMPRAFRSWMGWDSLDGIAVIERLGGMSLDVYVETLERFKAAMPKGKKHPRRACDTWSRSCSPLMLYGVPVAKMHHAGMRRVVGSGLAVWPLEAEDARRGVAVEAYPAMVAMAAGCRQGYKSENRSRWDEGRDRRARIVGWMESEAAQRVYGARLGFDAESSVLRESLIADGSGDSLDACAALLQAAYATRILGDARRGEWAQDGGWMVDPAGMP